MPSATDELRSEIEALFGDPIDMGPPLYYLHAKGFRERGGVLVPPASDYALSQVESLCVDFLCDEWDFGFEPALALTNTERT